MSREQLVAILRNLQASEADLGAPSAQPDALRLLHDLQVHQVELEMQNRELREAQGALEESRNRYADLYDFAPVAYCTLSDKGIIEELNLTGATLFGVDRERARGLPFVSLAKLQQPKQFWQHLGRCAATQTPVVTELTLTIHGRNVDVEAVSVPVLALGSTARSFRTAFTDITRRKHAESELERAHRSEQQLRERLQALDAAHVEVAAHLADRDRAALEGVMETITRHARSLLSAAVAKLDLAPSDGLETKHEPQRASQVDGLPTPGSQRELCIQLAYAGRVLGTLRVMRPVMDEPFSNDDAETLALFGERVSSGLRIAMLHLLETRETERLSLLELVSRELNRAHERAGVLSAIMRILHDACSRFVDAAVFYLPGGEGFELAHLALTDAARVPALRVLLGEHRGSIARGLAEVGGGSVHIITLPVDGDAGDSPRGPFMLLAELLGTPSLLVAPLSVRLETIGVLCVGRSDRSRAFGPAEASSWEKIAVRCALSLDNARLFEELKAALDWRETLMATISHDLKSPLSAITLSASALVPEPPIPERRKSRRQVELIRRSAEFMNHMVNDLLLENLLAAGSFQLELGSHAVDALLSEVCQLCEPLGAPRSLRIERPLEPIAATVRVDKERVLRVFTNLIGNAAKFSPEGGTIRIDARAQGAFVAFAVSDSGPGIPPEQQSKLFERYWRGSKGPRGLGLGLYIARSIVEAHGGAIAVDSDPGLGAKFTFTVPLAVSN